ncbi:MAG: hypothetical protein ABFR97_09640 [Thermodesulfobacteriota bacterium]
MKKLLIICCLLLLAAPAHAKNNKHKGDGHSQLPPGLQKKANRGEPLPPGWQKKLARGQHIDEYTYRHMDPVPRETIRLLPPLPRGVSYRQVEGDIIKIHRSSMEILDVLDRNRLLPPIPGRR